MKTSYWIGGGVALLVIIIIILIYRKKAVAPPAALAPIAPSSATPVATPTQSANGLALTASLTDVGAQISATPVFTPAPPPTVVIRSVATQGADGYYYNLTLPSPYNSERIYNATNGNSIVQPYADYFMYHLVGNPGVNAIRFTGTAAQFLDWIGASNITWAIDSSGNLISGSF